MLIGLIIVSVLLVAVFVLLLVTNNKLCISREDNARYLDDNKKLYAKTQRLEANLREVQKAEENLSNQHEELRDNYDEVVRVAYTDSLTELPNKEQFYNLLNNAMMSLGDREKIALSVIRLANYEKITNNNGQVAGDELILDFSTRLKANLTDDDFVARIGVDEFAVITQNFDVTSEFEKRMGALNRVLRTPFTTSGREISPIIYFAVSIAPQDGKNLQLLRLNVRLALAEAINEGEPKIYYYEEKMAEEAMKKMELTAELNKAVEENSFVYLCQAETDLTTGEIASFNILPVWDNERYGRMFPSEYLKYAEDTLIAKKIFSMLIMSSCKKQKKFEDAGYGNISFIIPCFVGQFIDEDFVKIVYNALEETDATPGKILISVPEAVFLKNPIATIQLMKKIEKLGIRFVLDEFGTGSSSLKALIKAPISHVRIAEDILSGELRIEGDIVIKSLIELIHTWNLKAIVSGVEYAEQENYLKWVHADYAEGELYNGFMTEEIALQIARITKK